MWLKQMDTKTLLTSPERVKSLFYFFRTSSESPECGLYFGIFLVTAGHLHDTLHQNQNAFQMCHSHSWRCLSWLETSDRPVSSVITFTVQTHVSALEKAIFIMTWIQSVSKAVASWLQSVKRPGLGYRSVQREYMVCVDAACWNWEFSFV